MERRVLANTIEYTKNPPGKETQCLANAVSSFTSSKTFTPIKPARRAASGSGGGVIPSIDKCFAQPVDEWKIENGKLSFKQPLRKKCGVNAIGLLLPLQMGKNGGANTISLSSLLQAWKWGVKDD